MALAAPPLNPKNRSVVDFTYADDPWPHIATWAARHRFKLRSDEPNLKLYRRGGWFTTPMFVQVSRDGDRMRLQTWIVPQGQLGGNGMVEVNLETKDIIAPIARRDAKTMVNQLLVELGAPAID